MQFEVCKTEWKQESRGKRARSHCEPASQNGNVFPPLKPGMLSAHQPCLSANTLYRHNYKRWPGDTLFTLGETGGGGEGGSLRSETRNNNLDAKQEEEQYSHCQLPFKRLALAEA